MRRKVCVVVTARPSYSRVKSALRAIVERSDLELQLVVAASALLDRYGSAVKVIENDGFPIAARVYMILEGEVDSWFDGNHYHLKPGDIAWAGVGCIHEFRNPTQGIVRWLETQAPQPPRRYSYRFRRDWTYLEEALKKEEEHHG